MRVIGPVMRGVQAREASRERLTSLGTMAAGLAHELNNPAAAARRAASDLVDAVDVINHALRGSSRSGIEREDAAKLLELQREALERCWSAARSTRSTRPTPRTRCSRRWRTAGSRTPGASPSRSPRPGSTRTGSIACRRSPGRPPRRRWRGSPPR